MNNLSFVSNSYLNVPSCLHFIADAFESLGRCRTETTVSFSLDRERCFKFLDKSRKCFVENIQAPCMKLTTNLGENCSLPIFPPVIFFASGYHTVMDCFPYYELLMF